MTSKQVGESSGFLDYYSDKEIIPVSQEHIEYFEYTRQRRFLYRQLGIIESSLSGRSVCEFGPGTARNGEFLFDCGISRLTLVEGNPTSIKAINQRFGSGRLPRSQCHLVEADFTSHLDLEKKLESQQFDIVLAENCLHGQESPVNSLRNVSKFVSAKGVLVVTSACSVSVLSDLLRRSFKPYFLEKSNSDFGEAVSTASDFFKTHLKTLDVASRTTKDWVLDQIFHPWPMNWQLSFETTIETLEDFEFLASAPQLAAENRWFKELANKYPDFSKVKLSTMQSGLALLLDYRIRNLDSKQDKSWNRDLRAACLNVDFKSRTFWHSHKDQDRKELIYSVDEVANLLAHCGSFEITLKSIKEFKQLSKFGLDEYHHRLNYFPSWFGRGTQYQSFTRRT